SRHPVGRSLRHQLEARAGGPVITLGLQERKGAHRISDGSATHTLAALEQDVDREIRRELQAVAESDDRGTTGAAYAARPLMASPRLRAVTHVRPQADARDRVLFLAVRS